jgi:hypothetical protein
MIVFVNFLATVLWLKIVANIFAECNLCATVFETTVLKKVDIFSPKLIRMFQADTNT